ncbi:MAG: CapA family protein [Treponema sp.]|jgi:poly-gamma-glutamate synthesis protein (capsule biosynthesis protein)|nr:CapA family protein [Treponema sp.]
MQDRAKNTAAFILLSLILASCGSLEAARLPDELPPAAETAAPHEEEPHEEEPRYLSIVAAGDNLFHETIVAAFNEKEGYNFAPVYETIKPVIEGADLAFINQETVLGRESFGYSGYPRFNTPRILAQNLADAGFDIINQANNHIMDMGEAGVMDTIAAWDAVPGTVYLGIHRSPEEREGRHIIIEKNGIRVGFLAYTYGTNGLPLPGDKPYLVSLIERETMSREIGALRPLCDFLIVSMHWGEEYAPSPSAGQTALAEFLASREVDLVIGHHPHVLQPAAFLPRPGGGQMLCFYSLGNFMSSQRQASTMLGGLMYVKLSKSGGNTALSGAGLIPVVTHYEPGPTGYRVYPLYQYSGDILKKHRLHQGGTGLNAADFYSVLNKLNIKIIMYNPFNKKTVQKRGLAGP